MNFKQLIHTISQTHDYLQQKAIAAVNQSLTIRNWLIGLYIIEYEQKGEDRARYGAKLLASIAKDLKGKGIKGLAERNLAHCRLFYQTYPQIGKIVSDLALPKSILQSVTAKLVIKEKSGHIGVTADLLIRKLSFTHIVELIQEDEPLKRAFYEIESIRGNWAVRELQRQRGSLLYERTGLSKNKEKLIQMTNDKAVKLEPQDIIKSHYIFEFMGLKDQEVLKESKLEEALLDHLQQFLLELGKGFCFESRQKRILIDDEHYRIDLVFYHRILKCHVLIDLKVKKFSYADAGQMTVFLNYFREHETAENDNPPIGIILCADKGQSLVKYATTGIDNQLFVSKYKIELPTEKELKQFIEEDQKRLK
jgi:predicted nuclease of restriction endonuclease-like (RecB) superfamily